MYEIQYLPEVVSDQIPSLSLPVRRRIKKAIEKKLAVNPIAFGKPLRHSLKGLRRLRVDDYRVIFRISEDNQKVLVVQITNRKAVYE